MFQRDSAARTINPTKPKIFLADLEFAKKLEWERRRKLRLKQVRQQARDIAGVIRNQAIQARKRNQLVKRCEQLNSELISAESKKDELEEQLSECLTSVGTAHSSASALTEVDELVRHRKELQDSLAGLRAELAGEKAKETRKPRAEVAVNPREGISISKVTVCKSAVRPAVKAYTTSPFKSYNHNVPETPPNLVTAKGSRDGSGSTESVGSQPVAEKTIYSPPLPTVSHTIHKVEKRIEDSYRDGRKSCPPNIDVIEVEVEDDTSDSDSGQTWPPPSVRKAKSSKVRMYDHSARKCSEYIQQCGVVRMENPEPSKMKELIQEDEEMLLKKAEQQLENRRINLRRGVRALREEMAKQDWDQAIKNLCQMTRDTRTRKALTYPSGPDGNVLQNADKDSKEDAVDTSRDQGDGFPKDVPSDPLSTIVAKYSQQRENILQDQSPLPETKSDEPHSDEQSQLPLWLKAEVEAQNNAVLEKNPRAATPETVMETMNSKTSESSSVSVGSREPPRRKEPPSPETSSTLPSGSSHESTSLTREDTSTSSGAINVEIRFKGKRKDIMSSTSPSKRQSSDESNLPPVRESRNKNPPKDSSSTSYYSPPDTLNPQQLSLLNTVLSRLSVKNKNPVLHHYINRVLEMSRQSISDLDVSSSSELSIRSDLIKTHQSTPKAKFVEKSLRFEEDNSSTAVTVSSDPRPSIIDDTSSSDNAGEIAHLLRNIMELYRVYRPAKMSDPLSDSNSSYCSFPAKIGADQCEGRIRPEFGPLTSLGDETGLFEDPAERVSSVQPLSYNIVSGDKPVLNIPSELLPKPFPIAAEQPCSSNFGRATDVPDGYAMRPEQDPVAFHVPNRRPISSLSDIASEVSSIQSAHSNIPSRRATSPVGSIAHSDKDSTVSDISSDFISSSELLKNDLIPSTSTSSSSDFEDVFQSLGLGWALSTLRRIRNAKDLPADDSSKTPSSPPATSSSEQSKNVPSYRHSTPVKPKDCPRPVMESSDNDRVPSLTPPNLSLF